MEGYTLTDAAGAAVETVYDVSLRIEGGFVHVDVPGVDGLQLLSAPAIRRITYPIS